MTIWARCKRMSIINKLKTLVKKETVFCVSFVLALVSSLIVLPDKEYLNYPDYRTISLLFCLMIIVAGIRSLGVFDRLAAMLLKGAENIKKLSLALIMICFIFSMIITNDVKLITFVPFTIRVFQLSGNTRPVLKLVVLETIAANLGSMATPIGNPQNLYLYSVSNISAGGFALAVLPYAGISLIMLICAVLFSKNEKISNVILSDDIKSISGKRMAISTIPYITLLILCLLVVFRVIGYLPVLIIIAAAVLFLNRSLFKKADYYLLFTFLFFFIFLGNMKRVPQISEFLSTAVQGRELIFGILASQVISNVPAAILLSGFCSDYSALLTGVNLGGLGTLIASLASLISYKFYADEFPNEKGKYLKIFTLWNLLFLAVLTVAAFIITIFLA